MLRRAVNFCRGSVTLRVESGFPEPVRQGKGACPMGRAFPGWKRNGGFPGKQTGVYV